jgi:hypothetical protein
MDWNFFLTAWIFVISARSVGYQPFAAIWSYSVSCMARESLSAWLNAWCTLLVQDSMVPCIYRSHTPFSSSRMFSITFLSSIFVSSILWEHTLQQSVECPEQLAVFFCHLHHALFQRFVLDLLRSLIALGLKILFMSQCILHV